jgi:prepilin-type N-terminal cleavage/methylation domain-containing protein
LRAASRGFTLIEILVSTALTLLLMAAVVTMFGSIGKSVNESRSTLEMADRLRSAAAILQKDLAGATVTVLPPRRVEDGYFEIIEGPLGDGPGMVQPSSAALVDPTAGGGADGTIIDNDDRLLFTTRSVGRPFVGKVNPNLVGSGSIQSDVAEVTWFVRGRTLYRRVLLVAPWLNNPTTGALAESAAGFYARNDVSVRAEGNRLVANTLADLTRRENRFAHAAQSPFDARGWGRLGMPLLQECSHSGWTVGVTAPAGPSGLTPVDYWGNNPYPDGSGCDPETGALYAGPRVSEDVILTNVIGFDVKVYEPAIGSTNAGYYDLGYQGAAFDPNYNPAANQPRYYFYHTGDPRSGLAATGGAGTPTSARVYDTWTEFYNQAAYTPVNGFDDGTGAVDGPDEPRAAPPYAAPLRGIQIKIRTFEPDSRQVREVTVVQDFLPQ